MTFMEEELFKNDHMHFDCFNFYCTYSYVCVNSHTNNDDLIYHSNAGILKNSIRHSSPWELLKKCPFSTCYDIIKIFHENLSWQIIRTYIRFLLPITYFRSALSNSLGNEEPKSIKNLCFIKWPKKSNGLTKVSELVNSQPYAIKWKIRRKFDVPSTIPQTDHHKLASLEAGYSHSTQQLDFEASDPPLGKRVEFSMCFLVTRSLLLA